jgi:hypothetical protein
MLRRIQDVFIVNRTSDIDVLFVIGGLLGLLNGDMDGPFVMEDNYNRKIVRQGVFTI